MSGWEAVVNASLLLALALIIGFAHLSLQQQIQQSSLGHTIPGPPQVAHVPAGMSSDGTQETVDSQVPTNCAILLSDKALRKTCSLEVRTCQRYLEEDRTGARVSEFINIEPQVASPSRHPALAHCTRSVAFNSFTVRSRLSASACS
jgi:hypothetical protein